MMYSGRWNTPFRPDETAWKHAAEREDYIRRLQMDTSVSVPVPASNPVIPKEEPKEELKERKKERPNLEKLLEMISPEDSALIALIVFLLCDNTENDVVLLGILLYVLLSKEKG
jgi:hypothetical protein